MTWNVTARISAGFALMLALLAGLLITGFSAIHRINDGLLELNEKTTPLVMATDEINSSLLEARSAVTRHFLSNKLDQLGDFEAAYAGYAEKYRDALASSQSLSNNFPNVQQGLRAVEENANKVFKLAPTILDAHRSELEIEQKVSQQVALFKDMSDEIESHMLDLIEVAPTAVQTRLSDLYSEVMGLSKLGVSALDRQQSMAIRSVESGVATRLKRIEKAMTSFSGTSTAILPAFLSMEASFQRYKAQISGADSFVNSYRTQLTMREQVKKDIDQLDGLLGDAAEGVEVAINAAKTAADQRARIAQNTVSSSETLLLVFFGVALFVAGMASVLIIRSIRQPLGQVVTFIEKLADGDLRDEIHLMRQDELGHLARNTNILASKLRTALLEISANADSVAASASYSSELAKKGDVNAKRQQQNTSQFAASMDEMVSTVRDVAASASRTLEQVQEGSRQTEQGQRVVNENISSIDALAVEIERASHVISKLNERSNAISEVLEVIRNIANQTNLLALNAAIEAARAGEQGRGFAVVADEVRTLASRTQNSTTEIQDMIERLQQEAREAVTVMDQSQREANISVEKSRNAGQSLEKINSSMHGISMMNTQIASAAEEQSMVSQEMQKNIEEISNMAESSAQASKEGLAASSEVAKLAEGMKQLVGQFRLTS